MCTHILEAKNQGNRNSLVSSNIAGWVIPIQKDEVSLPTSFNQQLPTLFFASFCTGNLVALVELFAASSLHGGFRRF